MAQRVGFVHLRGDHLSAPADSRRYGGSHRVSEPTFAYRRTRSLGLPTIARSQVRRAKVGGPSGTSFATGLAPSSKDALFSKCWRRSSASRGGTDRRGPPGFAHPELRWQNVQPIGLARSVRAIENHNDFARGFDIDRVNQEASTVGRYHVRPTLQAIIPALSSPWIN